MKSIALFVLIGLMVGVTSCSKDATVCSKTVEQAKLDAVPKTQLNNDIAKIANYLQANGINATVDPSGLRYVINKQGSGGTPCISSSVVVNYSGNVMSGTSLVPTPFDAASNAQFTLSGLILGWQIAFPKLPAGSSATLYVPSGLAYGTASPSAKIPPNSVLVFDITLVSFQ